MLLLDFCVRHKHPTSRTLSLVLQRSSTPSCLCNLFRSCLLVLRQAQAPQHRPVTGDVRRQKQSLPGHGTVSDLSTVS